MRNVNLAKKTVSVLVLLLFAAGAVFAEGDDGDTSPKNTITGDIGPAVYLNIFAGLFASFSSPTGAFGIAAQYERQITEKVSVAGRLEYGIMGIYGLDSLRVMMYFISLEGHGRFYPLGSMFFLDGMFGYANAFSEYNTMDGRVTPATHFLKFGAKLGWRIDFGKPGGFVLEPGIGYYNAAAVGNTGFEENTTEMLGGLVHDKFTKLMFIEGVRFSIALGGRF
jgi:hypothetical protein